MIAQIIQNLAKAVKLVKKNSFEKLYNEQFVKKVSKISCGLKIVKNFPKLDANVKNRSVIKSIFNAKHPIILKI